MTTEKVQTAEGEIAVQCVLDPEDDSPLHRAARVYGTRMSNRLKKTPAGLSEEGKAALDKQRWYFGKLQSFGEGRAEFLHESVAGSMVNITDPANAPLPAIFTGGTLALSAKSETDLRRETALKMAGDVSEETPLLVTLARSSIPAVATAAGETLAKKHPGGDVSSMIAAAAATAEVWADPKAQAETEWTANANGEQTFISKDVFIAYRVAELKGQIRKSPSRASALRSGPSAATPPAGEAWADPKAQACSEWDANPAMRADWLSRETFVAYRAAELRGQVRTVSRRASSPAPVNDSPRNDPKAQAAAEWDGGTIDRGPWLNRSIYVSYRAHELARAGR